MSEPLLCVTVSATTTAELRAKRDAVRDADLVELRVDFVRDLDVAWALADRRLPAIVTCRAAWEGGAFEGPEEDRHRVLAAALALGAEYVDVERRAPFADDLLRLTGGRRIVLSIHDFDRVPADLLEQTQAMLATGAEIVKVAVKANRMADCVPIRELGVRFGGDGRLVVLAMGDRGLPTRILPGRFGSRWAYAGTFHDIGQLTSQALVSDYRFRSVGASTTVYGIVGGSVAHSVSPAMHNAAFKAAGIDAVYLPFPAVDAADFVHFGRGIGVGGASVTIPHKVAMVPLMDEVDDTVRRIGAVNTVKVVDARWLGRNTDVAGFLAPLSSIRGQTPYGSLTPELRAAVLGAGGAARAVIAALRSIGCRVTVHARDPQRAAVDLTAHDTVNVAPWPPTPGSWDLLVNCTPIGMYPHVDDTPVPAGQLTGRCVYDLIYNPSPTRLLREAAAAGCQTIDGLEMLVAQAHEQFLWWTGRTPPPGVMRNAAIERLSEFVRDENHVV